MWVEIKKDIFLGSNQRGLNFIIQLLSWYPIDSIPRYNILVNFQEIQQLPLYQELSITEKEMIQEEFDKAVTEGISHGKYTITNKNKRKNTFNIEEAIRYFMQPVSILLENSLNDSYFLRAIFWHFDVDENNGKRKLFEFVKNDWVQFVNAGGWTNIQNYITGKLKSFEHLAAINQKDIHTYLRCFVLMDSDKLTPSDSSTEKDKLKYWLEEKEIIVHILNKRAMENYMPDNVIDELITQFDKRVKQWVNVYKKLTPEQKNYLDYNKGFEKRKSRTEQPIKVQQLYSNLSEIEYQVLNQGLQLRKFKDRFPALFEKNPSSSIYKGSLLAREGGTEVENEFLEIIKKINDLL